MRMDTIMTTPPIAPIATPALPPVLRPGAAPSDAASV